MRYTPKKKAKMQAEKNKIFLKKTEKMSFSYFHDMLKDPLKFWMSNFPNILINKTECYFHSYAAQKSYKGSFNNY